MDLQILLLLLFGWFSTISGVLVGGYLVHRASSNSPFFRTESGGAYNLEDEFEAVPEEPAEMPETLKKYSSLFERQHSGEPLEEYDPGEMFQYGATSAAKPFTPPKIEEDEFGNVIEPGDKKED